MCRILIELVVKKKILLYQIQKEEIEKKLIDKSAKIQNDKDFY